MRKSMRKIVSLVLAGVMLLGVGAMAASFYQTFSPPWQGSGRVITYQLASGSFSPYINPEVYSVETLYVLTPYSYYQYATYASSFVTAASPGRRSFTYNSGYGGAGTRVYLQGCPNVSKFNTYTVSGEWGA